jgi:hypothetical protein
MLVVSRVRLEVSPLWTLSGHNAHKSIEQLHPSLLAVLRLQASSMLSHCSPTGTVPDSVQSCCMKVYSRSAAASTRLGACWLPCRRSLVRGAVVWLLEAFDSG